MVALLGSDRGGRHFYPWNFLAFVPRSAHPPIKSRGRNTKLCAQFAKRPTVLRSRQKSGLKEHPNWCIAQDLLDGNEVQPSSPRAQVALVLFHVWNRSSKRIGTIGHNLVKSASHDFLTCAQKTRRGPGEHGEVLLSR
jgi:hypothetical protein